MSFFASLYFIQGAVLAYVVNFQKPFLAGQGVSKETLGLFTSLLLLPFILKVALGAISDRVPWGRWGSRKPYMALGLGLFAACYMSLAGLNPGESFMTFAVLTWFASLGLALFDTCADGWAVDVAEEREQGALQASMVAGKSLGLIVMSFLFGRLAESHGYAVIFQILVALSVAVLLVVLRTPYQPRSVAKSAGLVRYWRDLWKPFYIAFGIFGIVYSVASFGSDGLITLHLSEGLGAGLSSIGLYGMGRGLGALLGAALYAWLSSRAGLMRAQIVALVFLGAGCLLPLSGIHILLSGVLWGMVWGFQETAYVTLAMRYAEGPWSATFFAISMIFSNLGTAIGEALAAPMVPRLGYAGVFGLFALVAWSSLLLVPAMMRPAVNTGSAG